MKKVGIMTFHSSHNYGAVLQAYALKKFCEQLGADTCIINYRTKQMENNYAVWKQSLKIKDVIKNILKLPRYNQYKRKHQLFERFMEEQLNLSPRYVSLDELYENPPLLDILITGSDQVWNAAGTLKDAYFLPFASPSSKRISYAASMGDTYPAEKNFKKMREYIDKMDSVSVREEFAAEFISEGFGIEAVTMPDPVFLLDKKYWLDLIEDNLINKPYIFIYCLTKNDKLQEIIDEIKEKTGYITITVSDDFKCPFKCDKTYFDVGPKKFLGLLKNAECVITNSFHGTAFSIVFEKKFYSVYNNKLSLRIDSLLSLVGLENRYIGSRENINWDDVIDYEKVCEKLFAEREKAQQYLNKNFE